MDTESDNMLSNVQLLSEEEPATVFDRKLVVKYSVQQNYDSLNCFRAYMDRDPLLKISGEPEVNAYVAPVAIADVQTQKYLTLLELS